MDRIFIYDLQENGVWKCIKGPAQIRLAALRRHRGRVNRGCVMLMDDCLRYYGLSRISVCIITGVRAV